MGKRLMSEMTWMEVRDAVDMGEGVILPIGATEQHGPHMPLCTDALLSEKMALDVAKRSNLIVAPTVCYGFRSRPTTGGGQTFPGTTSVRGSTLTAIIMDVVKEFIRTGFRKIVLFNWHFENTNFIYDAAYNVMEDTKQEYPDVKLLIIETPFSKLKPETMEYVFEGQFPGWGIEHASIFETSVMMYVAPNLVNFSKAKDDQAEYYPFYDMLPIPKRITTESGILWKATLASKEKGEVVWKEICENLVNSVNMEFTRWEKEN
ncbi:creatininase [Mesobacillus maritimus]|uniref:creatininase n=1 Tax=Mesobacillus maritimus TaxID=1643336 RepID=UPI00384C043B